MSIRWGVAALLAVGIGCGGSKDASSAAERASVPSLAPQVPPPRPEVQAQAVAAETAAQAPQAPNEGTAWRITSKGIGRLKLGAAVPEPAGGYDASYTASFYADAQPLEGFQLADPPALAVVSGGPFDTWGYDHPGEEAPASIRQRAVALARTGKLPVEMIVITDPRPKTAQGVGAGDSYANFARANPALAELQRFPGLWEEPSCVASEDTIWYFFDRCDVPDQAKVLRIVVRADDAGSSAKGESRRKGAGKKSERKH